MDSLFSDITGYWWVAALPAVMMVLAWILREKGVRWILLVFVVGLCVLYFSEGTSSSVGSALHQFVDQVVYVIHQAGSSLL